MSKSKKKAAVKPAVPPKERKKLHSAVKKLYTFLPMLLAVAALLSWLIPIEAAAGVSTAMLYQFANNGKLSGRADGNVYMRNGRIRGMTVPAKVVNSYTTLARSIFSSFSSSWNSLTDAARATWINADNVFISNRFGVPKSVSGKELYVACNSNLTFVAATPVTEYDQNATAPALTSLTLTGDVSDSELEMSFAATPIPAGMSMMIYATAPQRQGIYRPSQSKYRLIAVLSAAVTSPTNLQTAYVNKFTTPVAGDKIFVKAKMVNDASGQESAYAAADAVVQA